MLSYTFFHFCQVWVEANLFSKYQSRVVGESVFYHSSLKKIYVTVSSLSLEFCFFC